MESDPIDSFKFVKNTFLQDENMDFMTSTFLSGVVYDLLKHGGSLAADKLKESLRGWIMDDLEIEKLSSELNDLELNDEMSAKAIERSLGQSTAILGILEKIKPSTTNVTIQTHHGTGDNIGGNKVSR